MRTTKQSVVKLIDELVIAQDLAKTASSRVSEIKTELKAIMGTTRLLEASNYCVLIETRNRTDLDKDALMHDLGYKTFQKYQVRSEYEIMTVKPLVISGGDQESNAALLLEKKR